MIVLALLLSVWMSVLHVRSSASQTRLHINPALILNFARFVSWPTNRFESEESPLKITILGDERLAQECDSLFKGQLIHAREVDIKSVDTVSQISQCHMLYIAESQRQRFIEFIANSSLDGVLTMGTWPGFVIDGGIVGLVQNDKTVKFEIRADLARRGRLVISSKLLRAARVLDDR